MNFNIATAARQRDDHEEDDRNEEYDFPHENQGLTHLLPHQPLPTERERLVKPLATARGPKNIYDKNKKAELIQAAAKNSNALSGRIGSGE